MTAENSEVAESSELILDGVHIHPYARFKDAERAVPLAVERYRESFDVRRVGEGYVLCSPNNVLDARQYRISPHMALNDARENAEDRAFHWLLSECVRIQAA